MSMGDPADLYIYPGNDINFEGAQALAESLKLNTALTQLNLTSILEFVDLLFACPWCDPADFLLLDNKIGSEGTQALAESLKQNTTLNQLNLTSMSELYGFITCMSMVR